jgi:hypothetical protein
MEESPHESLNAVLDFIQHKRNVNNSCIFDLLMFLIKNISKQLLITIHCCKFS